VEGELYTRYDVTGAKDVTIERWFSEEIESPFVAAIKRLSDCDDIISSPLPTRNLAKEMEIKELGFIVPKSVEKLRLSANDRAAINGYLAALLVRSPRYLSKLIDFHDKNDLPLNSELPRGNVIKTVALENMLSVFEIYRDRISSSDIGLLFAEGSNELLFADSGISAEEPWRSGPIPFDIHAPITPRMAIEVLPVQGAGADCYVMRMNNRGTARMNRIVLQSAERFVFSRQAPPIAFIKEHFGKPAPKAIGFRMNNGNLETVYDRSRDR
jgi:hypothetical protein